MQTKSKIFINLIYEYFTPHGVLKNGTFYKKINSIFKKSLDVYESEHYGGVLYDYFYKIKKLDLYKINFINFEKIKNTNFSTEYVNLYIIENPTETKFYINEKMIKDIKQVGNYYFVIYSKDGNYSEEFINSLVDLKKKYLINKNRFIFLSEEKPDKNIDWKFLQINQSDFENKNLITNLLETIKKLTKSEFI